MARTEPCNTSAARSSIIREISKSRDFVSIRKRLLPDEHLLIPRDFFYDEFDYILCSGTGSEDGSDP